MDNNNSSDEDVTRLSAQPFLGQKTWFQAERKLVKENFNLVKKEDDNSAVDHQSKQMKQNLKNFGAQIHKFFQERRKKKYFHAIRDSGLQEKYGNL